MMIPGFVPGTVIDNNDPMGMGGCIISVDGIWDGGTPYWCVPGGWPGAGQHGQGAWYPLPLGAQVVVVFEFGNPEAGAVFWPAPYGRKEDGSTGGPTAIQAVTPADRNKRVVIWDDDVFTIYTTLDGDTDGRKMVLMDKESGSSITFDARDGLESKSHSIHIDSQTGIVLTTKGLVSIQGHNVKINGRTVMHGGGSI